MTEQDVAASPMIAAGQTAVQASPAVHGAAPGPGVAGAEPGRGPRLFLVYAPEDAWFVDGFLLPALRLSEDEVLCSGKVELGAVIVQEIERGAVLPVTVVARRPLVKVLALRATRLEAMGAGPAIVIADPRGDLPSARVEGAMVARALGVSARVSGAATSVAATRAQLWATGDAALLHIAAHAGARGRWRALHLADGEVDPPRSFNAVWRLVSRCSPAAGRRRRWTRRDGDRSQLRCSSPEPPS